MRSRTFSMRSWRVAWTLRISSSWIVASSGAARSVGFATKSTAPSSSARNTVSSPLRPLTTSTGVGRFAISSRRKVKPSMRGISRSRVIRSGRSWSALRSASSPSRAQPTTSTIGEVSSMRMIVRRL